MTHPVQEHGSNGPSHSLAGAWLLALLPALFLYMFYRSERTVINIIAVSISPSDWFESARVWVQTTLPISEIVVGFLPGSLWVYAATAALRHVSVSSLPLWPTPLMVAAFFEAQQALGLTYGVFDSLDIVGGFIGCAIALRWPSRSPAVAQIDWRKLSLFAKCGCMSLFLMLGLAYVWR